MPLRARVVRLMKLQLCQARIKPVLVVGMHRRALFFASPRKSWLLGFVWGIFCALVILRLKRSPIFSKETNVDYRDLKRFNDNKVSSQSLNFDEIFQRKFGNPHATVSIGNPARRDSWIAAIAASTPANATVLDVAAGAKPYEHLWQHCQYFSHEFNGNAEITDSFRGETGGSPKAVEQLHDFIGDVADTGAPAAMFDVVLLTEVLEHVPEPLLAIQELARVARKGGNIYITAPFTSGSHQQPYHFSPGYSPEWYQYAADKFDLEVVSIESQGDIFKLMSQELGRVFNCGGFLPGAEVPFIQEVVSTAKEYLLMLSSLHGDGSPEPVPCAREFTIGWMVHLRKANGF